MNIAEVCRLLPTKPPRGLIGYALECSAEDLGGAYMVMENIQVRRSPTIQDAMDNRLGRPAWMAYGTCTCCNQDFLTEKTQGVDAFQMLCGEDGSMYPLDDNITCEDEELGLWVTELEDGETMECPFCGSGVKVVYRKNIRGGRTKQIQYASYCQTGEYGGIIYWLVQMNLDEYAVVAYEAVPREAFLIDEKGELVHFTHRKPGYMGIDTDAGYWMETKSQRDTWDKLYRDWGSINHRKVGTEIYPQMPDTTGTTAEKTGLAELLKEQGWPPILYLKLWKKFPEVENIMKAGQTRIVEDIIRDAWRFSTDVLFEADKYLDRTKKRPHEILGISKEALKLLTEKKRKITAEEISQYKDFSRLEGPDMKRFLECLEEYRGPFKEMLLQAKRYGHGLGKLIHYLQKQEDPIHAVGLLRDMRNFAQGVAGDRMLTAEELWPRNLQQAHDRYSELITAQLRKKKQIEYESGFCKVLDRYGALEWTDGDLCIRLPRNNDELIKEGKVLRHCVGGYGSGHIAGSDTIFFVRKYRRPERSYYTLDINMTDRPRRVQLHGYGNERHGENKQYSHRIPQKVLQFCDRWEKEVLLPFYLKNLKEKKERTA